MNAEVLETISYVAFACSFLLIVVAIILFFKLDIRTIMDDLSGRRAERQIQFYREQNASYQKNKNLIPGNTGTKSGVMETDEITDRLSDGEVIEESEETQLLYNGTVLLTENETMLLEEENIRNRSGYKLVLNEIVVHTGERI